MPTTPHITRAFQWDLARQVERLDFLLEWLPRYAGWGYEELYLHLEDAVEYPGLPGVARADAYSYKQFARLVAAATAAGIRVVPIVNLLGHTQYLVKTPELRDLNELRDDDGRPLERGQICPLHPRTLEVAEKLLRDMAPFCTAGKVHVGLDESFHLGKCPRCRADVARGGLAAHFAGHVGRLHQLTAGLGLRMGLWADMLALLPAAIPLLPRDVIAYDWYYYPFARHPRVELRNFAETDLAAPLEARGIEYWGCPMNGAFRYEPLPVFGDRLGNILSWWKRCLRVNAGGFLITSWEASRLAIELTTVVDAAAACLWLDPGIESPQEMLARGFARVFGATKISPGRAAARRQAIARNGGPAIDKRWRKFARAALACDDLAFAGYYRWQINERWDVCLGRDGVAPYERELRALRRICTIPPPALAASLAFRLYLAKRDVFVRRAAEGVFRLRREIAGNAEKAETLKAETLRPRGGFPLSRFPAFTICRSPGFPICLARLRAEASVFASAIEDGRAAARAMWGRSRDRRVRGPNEVMVRRDKERLREWKEWLKCANHDPMLIWRATPVCGAWQLLFTVHNFAPAMQKVVVEQQQLDGTWTTLHGLHTIEFRAFAAKPRTGIRREFSVPIPLAASDRPAATDNRLRLSVWGLGQVAISDARLTNGVATCHPRGWPSARKMALGKPPSFKGFPDLDWTKNQGSTILTFGPPPRRASGLSGC